MMEPILLSQATARKIILHAAGLAKKNQFGTGIEAVYKVIEHLGFVQLDTNYVVERAHHQVMQARIVDYDTNWLNELTEEGKIFEYFTSDAGFLPMDDYRFTLPVKAAFKEQQKPTKPEALLMKQILDRVEREGPLMVGDIENDRVEASNGWWDWRPAKVALERLYLGGELMITRDRKFHKVYDLPLNLVPNEIYQTMPTPEEYARFTILRTLGALGICSVKEIAWRGRRVKGNLIKTEIPKLIAEGVICQVTVEGVKGPLYMRSDQNMDIEISEDAFVLSPFDILNVFRHRLKDFFDFDYQIECFVPAPKRKYGYFSQPILIGDRFVARMDAKAERKNKVLMVHNLHFEEVELDEKQMGQLTEALKAYVVFNQCRDITFSKCNKVAYLEEIRASF